MYAYDLNITFSTSKDLAKDFQPQQCRFHEFAKILQTKINYSPFQFQDNYRKESNSLISLCNALFLDFDSGMTIDKAKEVFVDSVYILATTKSHSKEKNGLVCDRFRIILPTETNLDITKEDYKELMSETITQYGADPACKDTARFYYGFEGSQIHYGFGRLFDIHEALDKIKRKKEIRVRYESQERKLVEFTGEKIDTLRAISQTNKMLNTLKFGERFGAGGRNHYLYACAMYLRDSGMTDDEVRNEILWIDNQGDGLGEHEINRTIFRSMRIK